MSELSTVQLKRLTTIFQELTGIKYGVEKIYLFINRLTFFVGINSTFNNYNDLIVALEDKKNTTLRTDYVDLLTTNYTYFFRESVHFKFLQHIFRNKFQDIKELRFWSAAASSGQEAYSMAIALRSASTGTQKKYKILGSDIATNKIEYAKIGRYVPDEVINHVHPNAIKKYFTQTETSFDVKPQIKNDVQFSTLNLMKYLPFSKQFHVIFLRNVLIYFKAEEKEKIINNIADYLHPDGYLIVSLSESLTGLKVPFKHVSNSIYVHTKLKHVGL
ncbi:MAG: chemotaxis protein CheR [Spirochaetaceae bacterium]